MGNDSQDPMFAIPDDMAAAAQEAKRATLKLQRIAELFEAASREVYAFSANRRTANSMLAEHALSDLLDGLVLDIEVTGDYTDELPEEFVRLIMIMLRISNYSQSFESYIMHVIASDRVNPGFVFRAHWPSSEPNFDRTPVVRVQRFADQRH